MRQLEFTFDIDYNNVRLYTDGPCYSRYPLAKMIYEFEWRTTPQGHEYWQTVYGKLNIREQNGQADYLDYMREAGRYRALNSAFTFANTDEGFDYWAEVRTNLKEIDLALDNNGSV